MTHPHDPLTVEVAPEPAPRVALVRAVGELDVLTAPQVRDVLEGLPLGDLAVVVVDLSGLTFIDSSGLGVIIGAQKRLRPSGGELRVVCDQGPVLRLLDVAGLSHAIAVFPTTDDALGATS